jgi:predicted Fe-Mo cluster-binding NifX family protein
MRVGIPIWNGRVSPVLDTAERLVVVDTGAAAGQVSEEVALETRSLPLRATRLAGLDLDVLVCGAVSTQLFELLEAAAVPVRPWVAGDAEEILQALTTGSLDRPCYRMPGCRGGRGRGAQGRNCRGPGGAQGRSR